MSRWARLYGDQFAACCHGGVNLVNDWQRSGEAVGDQHALVARDQYGTDLGTGREHRPQPGGGLVVPQLCRHHGDEGSRRR